MLTRKSRSMEFNNVRANRDNIVTTGVNRAWIAFAPVYIRYLFSLIESRPSLHWSEEFRLFLSIFSSKLSRRTRILEFLKGTNLFGTTLVNCTKYNAKYFFYKALVLIIPCIMNLINNRNNYESIIKKKITNYIMTNILLIIKFICVHLVTSSGCWFKSIFILNRLIKLYDFANKFNVLKLIFFSIFQLYQFSK